MIKGVRLGIGIVKDVLNVPIDGSLDKMGFVFQLGTFALNSITKVSVLHAIKDTSLIMEHVNLVNKEAHPISDVKLGTGIGKDVLNVPIDGSLVKVDYAFQ